MFLWVIKVIGDLVITMRRVQHLAIYNHDKFRTIHSFSGKANAHNSRDGVLWWEATMLPDREICCPAAPSPPPGTACHGDLPGPGQLDEGTLPGKSSVKNHQIWTSVRQRVHTSVPGCSSASRPDLRGRRRSWRWWWPRRPRPRGPSHPHSRHPRPYLKTFGFERWSVRATVVVRKSRERLC